MIKKSRAIVRQSNSSNDGKFVKKTMAKKPSAIQKKFERTVKVATVSLGVKKAITESSQS